MKKRNRTMRSIGIFALVLTLLVTAILPLAATASSDSVMGRYIVKKGDTLSSIASTHGVTVSGLVDINGISASSTLYEGQCLLIPAASSVEDDSTNAFGTSSKISISFKKDSSLMAVLKTILAQTGYKMIFKGAEDTKVPAISLENVTPLTAIDYVLRMVEMTYIKNDDILYVGSPETLNSNFIDSKALTRVTLKYLSVDALTSQLSALGVNVTVVKSDINLREFWVSAYPMELAKMSELIKTLDNKKNITVGSASISSSLSAIELKHITASEFSGLLGSLGLHQGITVAAHPMTLYVYVTGDAYKDIMNIKKLVDYADPNADKGQEGTGDAAAPSDENAPAPENNNNNTNNNQAPENKPSVDNSTNNNNTAPSQKPAAPDKDVVITDGKTTLTKITLQYIDKDTAKSIISTFGYDVEVLGLDLYEKVIWLRGKSTEVTDAVARIKENDVVGNNLNKEFFSYELKNIVASELQNKVGFVKMEGVEFYFGSYPTLSKSIMVSCQANKVAEVKAMLASLDNNMGELYYPIETITDQAVIDSLDAKKDIVCKLLNNPSITVDSFELSQDLDSTDEGVKYILYVLESPENIDLISDMWSRIG